jgi:hypothetical protein
MSYSKATTKKPKRRTLVFGNLAKLSFPGLEYLISHLKRLRGNITLEFLPVNKSHSRFQLIKPKNITPKTRTVGIHLQIEVKVVIGLWPLETDLRCGYCHFLNHKFCFLCQTLSSDRGATAELPAV